MAMGDYTDQITARFLLIKEEVLADNTCRSLADFSRRIGEYPQNITAMIKGRRYPTLEMVARACKEFGYSAQWLLLGEEPKRLDRKEGPGYIEDRLDKLESTINELRKRIK